MALGALKGALGALNGALGAQNRAMSALNRALGAQSGFERVCMSAQWLRRAPERPI